MFPVFNKEAYSWKHPIRNIRYFFVDCKNSLQRIRRGYSDEDAAMFCVWFRCVVPAMLRSYRRQLDANPGFPGVLVWEFYEEHERDMGFSYETFISSSATPDPAVTVWQERMEKECRKKWESIVDDMILLFSESDEDTCHRYNPYDREREGDAYIKEEQVLADYRDECLKRAFGLLGTWLDDLLL